MKRYFRILSGMIATALAACTSPQTAQLTDEECAAILSKDPTSPEAIEALAQALDRMSSQGGPISLNCSVLASRGQGDGLAPLILPKAKVARTKKQSAPEPVLFDSFGFAFGGGTAEVRRGELNPGLY